MTSPRQDRNEEAVKKAQADLKRLGEQSEKLLGASTSRDEEENDPVVIWGKRLGRGIGYLFAAYLLFYLLRMFGFV